VLDLFNLLFQKVLRIAAFHTSVLPFGDGLYSIFLPSHVLLEDITVVRKIGLAVVLMAMAGVASAGGPGSSNCFQILWFNYCWSNPTPTPVQAPEIDPASAMAGLTMLAGGLAVLRGRRRKNLKEQ
jgi:hypothetical protein